MSAIFGSSPSVSSTTAPTTSTTQQSLLGTLASLIGGAATNLGSSSLLSGGTNSLINQLVQSAANVPGANTGVAKQAQGTLSNVLGAQAPQVIAPFAGPTMSVGTSPVTANNINSAQAYQQGVAQPIINAFNTQLAPSLKAATAGNAGGAYSSGAGQANNQAQTNLAQTLAQQGTLYDLGAQEANQNANLAASTSNAANTLSASTSNASNDLATQLANLQAQLSTNQLNTGANLGEQGVQTTAATSAPSVQYGASSDLASVLTQLLSGSLTPTNEFNTLAQTGAGLSTAGTQQTNTVVQPGQAGLLSSLLGAAAPSLLNPGGTAATGATMNPGLLAAFLASDERIKDAIKPVGKLANGLPVYTFRYKSDPTNLTRIGLIAQDVEKVRPEAVAEDAAGTKYVNYALAGLKARRTA